MLQTSLDWTPFGQHLIDFIKKDRARPGSTNKEAERNVAVYVAEIEMITQSIAYLGTAERITALAPLMEQVNEDRRWVPMLDTYEVRNWLRSVRERWDNGDFKSVPDDEWLVQMRTEFKALVFSEGVTTTIQYYRKSLVLAGKMEPTVEDKAWLEDEYQNLALVADPYKAALAKLKG